MAYFTLNSNWQLLATGASAALLQSLDECRIYCGTATPADSEPGVLLTRNQEPVWTPVGELGGSVWARGSGGLRTIFDAGAQVGADAPEPAPTPTPTPTPTPVDGLVISGTGFRLAPFAHQNEGTWTLSSDGKTLSLGSNAWVEAHPPAGSITVTSRTVLKLDFSAAERGEIHGVEFNTSGAPTQNRGFQFYGTQTDHYFQDFHTYNGGTVTYTIPVGQYFTGTFNCLVFSTDEDRGSGATSVFSNIELYEA